MKFLINLFRYSKFQIKRLRHIKASPHEIALGFSFGVWTNFNPFFGVNLFIGMGLAFIFRANIIASVIGVLITGLPLIFPLFWYISWYAGSSVISENFSYSLFYFEKNSVIFNYFTNFTEYFAEMLLGSIILFPLIILFFYFPIKYFVKFWQQKRKIKLGRIDE